MYTLDHVGIAVEKLDPAIKEYQANFNLTVDVREILEERGVELVFLNLGNTSLELIAPHGERSPLTKFLSTRGPGLHHLCYRVQDISAELKRLEKLGHKLIDPVPRPGAKGSLIAFIHPQTVCGVLTELCQYP